MSILPEWHRSVTITRAACARDSGESEPATWQRERKERAGTGRKESERDGSFSARTQASRCAGRTVHSRLSSDLFAVVCVSYLRARIAPKWVLLLCVCIPSHSPDHPRISRTGDLSPSFRSLAKSLKRTVRRDIIAIRISACHSAANVWRGTKGGRKSRVRPASRLPHARKNVCRRDQRYRFWVIDERFYVIKCDLLLWRGNRHRDLDFVQSAYGAKRWSWSIPAASRVGSTFAVSAMFTYHKRAPEDDYRSDSRAKNLSSAGDGGRSITVWGCENRFKILTYREFAEFFLLKFRCWGVICLSE